MPGEYEHVADPYRRHQSLQALAESVGILTSSPSDSVVASPSLQNVVDHAATSENGTSAPAASSSSGSSSLHAFFTLLFLLVLLQSIVWLAQKVYARSMHAKRFEKGGGAVLQNFAFLSAAAPAFARYGTAFGFLLGVISMAVVQWLHSPDMIAHTLGTQPTVQHPTQHSAVQALTTTTQCEPKIIHVAAQCPTCPAPDTAVALVPSSAEHECARITDLSPGHEPIHFQPTYADVPLYPIDCDWQEGKWVERQGGLPKWFTEVDRWQMFGPQAKGKDLKHVFQPPSECKGSFREFDPKKFLKALEGKTIAFLGDSMIRQLHGVITSLLYEEVLGHTLYYPKGARYLDAIREWHFTHNVTVKNQWIMGHTGPDELLFNTFPTIWRSDLLVVNIGAFFQNGAAKEEQFRETLQRFMKAARKKYKGTIIWREYSPTHFDTKDGEYSADLMGFTGGCKAWDPTSPGVTPSDIAARHHNYRVTIAEEVMREYQVPVLHVFNTSLRIPDAHQAHPGAGDCRHWFNPSSVLEHWATVLYNMVVPPDE